MNTETDTPDQNNIYSVERALCAILGKIAARISSSEERFIVIKGISDATIVRVRWLACLIPDCMAWFFLESPWHKKIGYLKVYSVALQPNETFYGVKTLSCIVWSRPVYNPIKSKLKEILHEEIEHCGIAYFYNHDCLFYDPKRQNRGSD